MTNPTWKFEITEMPNGGFTVASFKNVSSFEKPIVIAAASKPDLSRAIVECMDAERNAEGANG